MILIPKFKKFTDEKLILKKIIWLPVPAAKRLMPH